MLTSIFQWLTSAIGGGMDTMIQAFLSTLDLNLSEYLTAFPLLANAYDILQIIGLGFTLLIAAIGLFQFLTIRAFEGRYAERPEQIIYKSAIAAGLIYFGGYILELIVSVASFSFQMFYQMEEASTDTLSDKFSVDSLTEALETTGISLADSTLDLVLVTVALVLVILVAYNVFKLMLEVAERYMMVGVLVFTSPLVYSTLASNQTSQIFKRWVSMFVSSCILMSMSALFLKLIVNGLYAITVGDRYFTQLLLVLAMCKIAQRVDTYMGQLGLNAAVTGGGILDDIAAVGGLVRSVSNLAGHITGNGRGSRNRVLGPTGSSTGKPPAMGGTGPAAAVVNGLRQGRAAFVNGAAPKEAAKAAVETAKSTMKDTPVGGAIAGAVNAKKSGANVAEGAVQGLKDGFKAQVGQTVVPNMMNERRNNMEANAETQIAANHVAHERAEQLSSSPIGTPVTDKIREDLQSGVSISNSTADANFAAHGIAVQGESAILGQTDASQYRDQAMEQLAKEYPEFAKDYSAYKKDLQFTDNSSAEEAFNAKWGSAIDDKAPAMHCESIGDGAGLQLGENARASGLTMETDDHGQNYVHGRDMQTSAFLANEYGRDPQISKDYGVREPEAYERAAIEAMASDKRNSNHEAYQSYLADDSHMSTEELYDKHGDEIRGKAKEFRESDMRANQEANSAYKNIVSNTAIQASPNASLSAFFDSNGTLENDDRLGNAMMERAFTGLAAERAEGTAFSNIRAYSRENAVEPITGGTLYGGRVLEADYCNAENTTQRVRIYDQTAYTSLTAADRNSLFEFHGSDGRTLYSTVAVQDEPRVTSNGNKRTTVRESDAVIKDTKMRSFAPRKRSNKNRFKKN